MSKSDEINVLEEKGIIVYPLDELMGDRFGRYAKYIIQERALPDVRDGLKPVQRRILYAMNELKLTVDKPYKKSARIVGEVIGKYHPHGDTSIYDALVRMSQSWKLGMPLIDMQGNNGSIDGDGAAAMRYTEARLSKISNVLLKDLDKDTVLFAPNFDDSEREPTVLPAYYPNILVNGSTGIAAGYATNIPPHNLNEVINAVIALIKDPTITLSKVMRYIKGPDFPTGGVLQGIEGIKDAFKTGKGKVILNSKWHEEKNAIIIDEIPYEVVKQDLVRKIGEVADNNPGLGIKEVRDETDREGLRIAIDLNPKANLEVVRKFLFKSTPLSVSYNYNNVVIIDKQPRQVGVIEMLQAYIKHYNDVYTRKSNYELKKAKDRLEIVDGLIKAMSILDEVIKVIRGSENRQDAIKNLVSRFDFSDTQAAAIVDMRLYRLTSTDVVKLQEEKNDLENKIKRLNEILNNQDAMNEEIVANLQEVQSTFPIKRRTVIEDEVESLDVEVKETIVEKEFNLFVSKDGYIKAIDNSQMNRYEKADFGRKPGDIWIASEVVSNLDHLLLTSSAGTYYSIPLYKLSSNKWKDLGTHVNEFATMAGDESIISAIVVKNFEEAKQQILVTTKLGMIKRVIISELETKTFSKSFRLIKLDDKDEVVSAELVTSKTRSAVIITTTGYGVRYDIEDIPVQGTNSKGVKASTSNDNIASGTPLTLDQEVLFVTDKDNMKKLDQNEIPLFVRPKKGIRLFPERKRGTEFIINGFSISEGDQLVLLNTEEDIKEINTNRIKALSPKDTNADTGINDISRATLETAYKVTPHDMAPGSENGSGDGEVKPKIKPVTPVVPKTQKANTKVELLDEDKKSEIKQRVDSLSSSFSLLDELDMTFSSLKKEPKEEVEEEDDFQLSFDDLLDD